MNKLFLLILPVLFLLAGCWSPSTLTPISEQQTGLTSPTSNTLQNSVFDASKIVLEGAEISFEWYHLYKEIVPFKDWFIGINMWGQDWYAVSLIYTRSGTLLQTSDPIFWYDRRQTDKKIYEYCLGQLPNVVWLDSCPLAKTIASCVSDKTTWDAKDCVNQAFEYVYNLLQWSESNSYFYQKMMAFKDSL